MQCISFVERPCTSFFVWLYDFLVTAGRVQFVLSFSCRSCASMATSGGVLAFFLFFFLNIGTWGAEKKDAEPSFFKFIRTCLSRRFSTLPLPPFLFLPPFSTNLHQLAFFSGSRAIIFQLTAWLVKRSSTAKNARSNELRGLFFIQRQPRFQ